MLVAIGSKKKGKLKRSYQVRVVVLQEQGPPAIPGPSVPGFLETSHGHELNQNVQV